jgi:biopolymer transport protein ExbB
MEPNQVVVDNPYGLQAMLNHGGAVTWGVFAILMLMSAGSWFIMFMKWLDQRKLAKQQKEVVKNFWTAKSLQEGANNLKGKDHAFKMIAESGLRASQHHDGALTDQIPKAEWVTMSLERSQEQLNSSLTKGLSFLATVGSTSPFVGLFGTVWGILNALTTIGTSGDASISKVAGPVGEALIMTAIGLAVAVPAVMGYNVLLGNNKRLMEQVRHFTGDLHAMLVSGARVQSGGGVAASTPRAK